MSLSKPGPGDIIDRCSILARKMVERPERSDFESEFKELTDKHGFSSTLILAALNAAIWQREDRLRELGKEANGDADWNEEVAAVALEIQDLNDRRAALIAELNGTPSEKLYK